MLVDTDVMIWHLRGLPAAIQRLDRISNPSISAVTWIELVQGFRNSAEMAAAKKSLEMRNAQRLPITANITERAVVLMETYALSHGLRLGDALIAATGLEHELTVLTANIKHFIPIEKLRVERFEPQSSKTLTVHDEGPVYNK